MCLVLKTLNALEKKLTYNQKRAWRLTNLIADHPVRFQLY